jgi:hypothetical protein
MNENIVEMAYKCWCYENGVFNNERNKECHLIKEYNNGTKYVYEKATCNHDIMKEYSDYDVRFIDWNNVLMECHLWYEYFISYLLIPKENKDEIELEDTLKEAKLKWHERFLNLIDINDKSWELKCPESVWENEMVHWPNEEK